MANRSSSFIKINDLNSGSKHVKTTDETPFEADEIVYPYIDSKDCEIEKIAQPRRTYSLSL